MHSRVPPPGVHRARWNLISRQPPGHGTRNLGSAAFLFLHHADRRSRNKREGGDEMSISVLDTYAVALDEVADEQLPCRRENPELFFAETPHDVEVAKALCQD